MRPISLLILVAIVGGGAYVFFFKPEWIGMAEKKAKETLLGYGPATSPREAMEKFHKAVKERKYDYAALYCSGDYAAKLINATTAAAKLGAAIDRVNTQIDEKGFKSPKITQVLLTLDPYPNIFKIGDVKESKDPGIASGTFISDMEPLPLIPNNELTGMDPKMFTELPKGGFAHAL